MTKSQRGMSELLRQSAQEARKGNESLRQQFRSVANKFLNSIEISAQEAAYILLQLPMKKASRRVLFVNTNLPQDRIFLLKSQNILDAMDEDNEDVQLTSLITKYEKRPTSLENVTLAEFASWYNFSNVRPIERKHQKESDQDGLLLQIYEEENTEDLPNHQEDNDIQYTRRKTQLILRTCHFDKNTKPEEHYHELLLLYTCWRNEGALKGDCETYQERFQQIQDSVENEQMKFELHSSSVDQAVTDLDNGTNEDAWDLLAPSANYQNATDISAEDGSISTSGDSFHYDIGLDLGLPTHNIDPLLDQHEMSDDKFRDNMRNLNKQQFEFLNMVLYHAKTNEDPICYFLSGGAGVDKTHTTNMLYQCLLKYYNSIPGTDPSKRTVLLMAPTGKAAFLIRGNTSHSALKLPFTQRKEHSSLNTDKLNTLRSQLSHVKFIIIDEISMVGSSLFSALHRRLQELTGSSKDFGGISVIAVGDLFQLKPVGDSLIFTNKGTGYLPLATNLWKKHFHMHELTCIMRQKDCQDFAHLLNRMREGKHTKDDEQVLLARTLSPNHADFTLNIPHLFLTNAKVHEHNQMRFHSTDASKAEIFAIDTVIGKVSNDLREKLLKSIPDNPAKTLQLHSVLHIACGLHYDVSLNINTQDGLANGATCVIQTFRIVLPKANGIIWVKFDNPDIGRETRLQNKNLYIQGTRKEWIPILPVNRQFTVGKNAEISRTQFPLRSSEGKTVHRSQGDTMEEVVVDFAGRTQSHIHYVATSRVKTPEGLHLLNFKPENITVHPDVTKEIQRLRNLPQELPLIFLHNLTNSCKIAFLNAQSLHKHLNDVLYDPSLTSSDILICAETRFLPTDSAENTNLPSYTTYRNDEQSATYTRPFHGMSMYVKQNVTLCAEPSSFNQHQTEVMLASITLGCQSVIQNLQIIALYKYPTCSVENLIKTLLLLFDTCNTSSSSTIVLGDFNVDLSTQSTNGKKLPDFFAKHGFSQHITSYTTNGKTRIDHIYSNFPIPSTRIGIAENYFSYHKGIWVAL